MSRRVDEVQQIHLSIPCLIVYPRCLQLDGDTSLALDIQVVKQLLLHVTGLDRIGGLQQSVGKSALPVICINSYS